MRPVGLARGAEAYVAAWLGGTVIAVITGATAVVMLLALSLVGMVAAVCTGPLRLRRARVDGVVAPTTATPGEPLTVQVAMATPWPVHLTVRCAGAIVAAGWADDGTTVLQGTAPPRGMHEGVVVRCATAGRLGIVWWQRTVDLAVALIAVAPAPAPTPAPVDRAPADTAGASGPGARPGSDDLDGVRPWRDGDEAAAIHWPTTVRSGELVVRQQRRDRDERLVVRARRATGDGAGEAARVRRAVEEAWARGSTVAVAVDGGSPGTISDRDDLLHWTAAFDGPDPAPRALPWWRRPIGGRAVEPDNVLTPRARWAVAAASLLPMAMLLQPLGYGPAQVALVAAGLALGALLTARSRPPAKSLRQLAALGVGAGLFAVLADLGAVDSVVAALRFVFPQLLVTLCVVQGFECTDRRAARVTLATSGVLAAYAAGVRIDDRLGVWLLAVVVALAAATQEVSRPDRQAAAAPPALARDRPRHACRHRSRLAPVVGTLAAVLATLGVLAVVPVPSGPAQLTLPTWLHERRPTAGNGALATVTGSPLLGGPVQGDGRRTGAGAGGYPGFSPQMDTALRGDLGDEVVLRVRAAAPDFWRGQTFVRFDGRRWYVADAKGIRSEGPDHAIRHTVGHVDPGGDELIQTYYLAVDLPNIVFAAATPEQVLLDAPLWQRPDGSLRADVVLPAGSAYTVVSRRSGATGDGLRADGDLSRFTVPADYVQIPASTTARTKALARTLADGSASTYDTILAIQRWLGEHVVYDLDAPVPPEGTDAVDDFLFRSQRGFCEQIATATAVLLRSLGVPTRVATGYVPSERDEVAGVWISRASDAHAWVEVWFPSYGWVAFDPTAAVPLSGEAGRSTVGGDLLRALGDVLTGRVVEIVLALVAAAATVVVVRAARHWHRRRRRGRWGLLQDRFVALAVGRGASPAAANQELAAVFDDPGTSALAAQLATDLDASAFAVEWPDDDTVYERDAAAVRTLERTARSSTRT